MKKTCTYYWNKVATLYFADLDQQTRLDYAFNYLGRDEYEHLLELLKEG